MGFNKPRLQPPSVQYIVAMTCRKTVQIEKARIDKYNWIDVYFLEELLDAGVFAEDHKEEILAKQKSDACLLYTSPSPRDLSTSRMPSSA